MAVLTLATGNLIVALRTLRTESYCEATCQTKCNVCFIPIYHQTEHIETIVVCQDRL